MSDIPAPSIPTPAPMPGQESGADARFKYQSITKVAVSEDDLHMVAKAAFDPNATKLGYFGLIYSLIRMVLGAAYLIALYYLAKVQEQIAKQKYEQTQDAQSQSQVDDATDGLDEDRKPVQQQPKPPGGASV